MKTWLRHLWGNIRSSFWFIPGLLTAGAIVLAYVSLKVDRSYGVEVVDTFDWLRTVSAEGTRQLLSTVASSVLTLAGLTFSSTLVALTMASAQFGPRLIRNFIRSMGSQIVLGGLLGTFAYCLLVLRAVRSVENGEFIPHLSALIAFGLTLTSLLLFIYFIHYLAKSIQAETVVARVYVELKEAINRFFPEYRSYAEESAEREEEASRSDKVQWEELEEEMAVRSKSDGYLVGINDELLVEIAKQEDTRFRVLLSAGEFVTNGEALLAYPKKGGVDEETCERITKAFVISQRLTSEEDFLFCFRQLEEVALRALSPGINDPFTAFNCIDYIGAALKRIAQREMPKRFHFDEDGKVRLRMVPITFRHILTASMDQIRQSAADKPRVTTCMLDALLRVSDAICNDEADGKCTDPEAASALLLEAKMLGDAALAKEPASIDREAIQERLKRLRKRCGEDE